MASPSTGGRRCLRALAALAWATQCLLLTAGHPRPRPAPPAIDGAFALAVTTPVAILSSQEVDSEESRRVLGSSVVTSVSVVADGTGEGETLNASSTRTYSAEPAGMAAVAAKQKRPQGAPPAAPGPGTIGSPAGLMSPDRYEFYTFDETGDLVRRHMTLDEIKSLLAGGDGDLGDNPVATFYHGPVPPPSRTPAHHHHHGVVGGLEDPEDALEDAVKGVQDVVNNVQNVLKSQLAASKNKLPAYIRPPPAASHSEAAATWGMILPGIMEGGLPPRPVLRPAPVNTKKPTLVATTAFKRQPARKPATTSASSSEEPLLTRAPTTTEQDVVDTLYTLVSSSPSVKNTASDNASDPHPQPAPRPTTPPPRPSPDRPQRPSARPQLATTRPARPAATTHRTGSRPAKPAAGKPAKPAPTKPMPTKPSPTKPTPSKPSPTKPTPSKPSPTEPTPSKPSPTKPTPSKPSPTKPTPSKPATKPLKPATLDTVQQRRPFPQHGHEDHQQHAESMVKIVTIQRPAPTTTMTPFVTFIPTDTTAATQPTTLPPAAPTTTAPTTTIPSKRPPAISYTYRMTTAAPPATETVSSADLDMDSRTTDDEEEMALTTGTLSTPTAPPPPPATTSPSTSPSTVTVWTTSLPSSLPVRTTTTPWMSPMRTTTQLTTTDTPSDVTATTVTDSTESMTISEYKPIRYTAILTRVPASALVSRRPAETAVQDDSDPASTSTVLPTTERAEEATTTPARTTEAATTQDAAEQDVGAEESAESIETEATTKLYLKISSSETNGHLYQTSTTPATEVSSSEQYSSSETSSEASSEASAEAVTATTTTDMEARTSVSMETSVPDQSAASTEQRTTTATAPPATSTTASATSSEQAESRTESMTELDTTTTSAALSTSSAPSATEPMPTLATAITSAAPVTTTAVPATHATHASTELSLESSNVRTSQVDAPQASNLESALTTSAPAATTTAADVEANKVETEATPQPMWTRVPVVSSAEDEGAAQGAVKANEVANKPAAFHSQQPAGVELHAAPHEHLGLEAATAALDADVRSFVNLCNDLAFQMWMAVKDRAASTAMRSLVMSPFATTSTLAMVFLGARGPTSGQMNDVLRLDDMVSFNPHQVMWNVTEALVRPRAKNAGVATAALVRELYSDKNKGKLLDFYKERAQQFYDGHVEEITFRSSGDLVRRKTNLLVKRQTRGRVQEYMRGASLALRPPLAAFGANIFETDCSGASTEGRDGEMHFVVVPSSRQRRLVPVPAAVWRSGFLAGYEPSLDATAVAMGPADAAFSTVLVLPGQQGHVAPGDGLSRLEQRLLESRGPGARWARLLRSLLPRPGLELQVPRFSHRSVLNMSEALQRMGLDELFSSEHADLRGLNGVANDLHLSDVVQLNTFSTCGERAVDSRHHVEFFPTSPLAAPGRRAARGRRVRPRVAEEDPSIELHPDNVGKDRDAYYARLGEAIEAAEARGSSGLTSSEEATASDDGQGPQEEPASSSSRESRTFQRIADFEDPDLMKVPLALRPRQARIPEAARLRFDRPFLFFVRHNPTGVLLHMGRFNPRLLP